MLKNCADYLEVQKFMQLLGVYFSSYLKIMYF